MHHQRLLSLTNEWSPADARPTSYNLIFALSNFAVEALSSIIPEIVDPFDAIVDEVACKGWALSDSDDKSKRRELRAVVENVGR